LVGSTDVKRVIQPEIMDTKFDEEVR
jgi:hypothetical protein